jgi:hypothetical protein
MMLLFKLRCGESLSKFAFKFDLRHHDAVLRLAVINALVAGAPGQDTGSSRGSGIQQKINVAVSNRILAEHVWQGVITIY